MASEGTNHHLVTLFLISNSFCGFGFGVFLFAVGVGKAVIAGTASAGYIRCICSGFSITVVSMGGCFGAITQNKMKLSSYIFVMIILSILEILHLVKLDNMHIVELHNQMERQMTFCVSMIFLIVFTLVSILLALTIGCRIVSAETSEKERQQQGLGAA